MACVKKRSNATEAYEMTGNTGTLVYMAPEVALRRPYTEKVDIYSIGVILWQMTSGEIPFTNMKRDEYMARVVNHGYRLRIREDLPEALVELIERCWDPDPLVRPSSEELVNCLDVILDSHLRSGSGCVSSNSSSSGENSSSGGSGGSSSGNGSHKEKSSKPSGLARLFKKTNRIYDESTAALPHSHPHPVPSAATAAEAVGSSTAAAVAAASASSLAIGRPSTGRPPTIPTQNLAPAPSYARGYSASKRAQSVSRLRTYK